MRALRPSFLSQSLFAHLLAVLLMVTATAARGGSTAGIGVMGDSVADEYRFATIIEPGGNRPDARNFVEVLSSTRHLNFGPLSSIDRGTPRGKGFEYDWALEGDRSADLLAHGQHTGLAAQASAGQVDLVWMFIGGNDFRDLYDPAVIGSPDPGAAIGSTVVSLATNVTTAIQTVLAANPQLNLVVANVPDLRSIPGLKAALAATPALIPFAAAVDQGIQAYNAQLAALAASNSRVAVVDAYAISQPAVAGLPVQVDGLTLDTNIPGNGADHYFVDAIHPGTAASGILGNAFIQASNNTFGAGLVPLTDAEIASAARASAIPLPAPLWGGVSVLMFAMFAVKRFHFARRPTR